MAKKWIEYRGSSFRLVIGYDTVTKKYTMEIGGRLVNRHSTVELEDTYDESDNVTFDDILKEISWMQDGTRDEQIGFYAIRKWLIETLPILAFEES